MVQIRSLPVGSEGNETASKLESVESMWMVIIIPAFEVIELMK